MKRKHLFTFFIEKYIFTYYTILIGKNNNNIILRDRFLKLCNLKNLKLATQERKKKLETCNTRKKRKA